MIVADANLIAALILPVSEQSDTADRVLMFDRDWAAPTLWRSEFCNILATAQRNGVLTLEVALEALEAAEQVMAGSEFSVSCAETLKLAAQSGCTAYDSEYVLLARELGVHLVTFDTKVLRAFPEISIHPAELLERLDAED